MRERSNFRAVQASLTRPQCKREANDTRLAVARSQKSAPPHKLQPLPDRSSLWHSLVGSHFVRGRVLKSVLRYVFFSRASTQITLLGKKSRLHTASSLVPLPTRDAAVSEDKPCHKMKTRPSCAPRSMGRADYWTVRLCMYGGHPTWPTCTRAAFYRFPSQRPLRSNR